MTRTMMITRKLEKAVENSGLYLDSVCLTENSEDEQVFEATFSKDGYEYTMVLVYFAYAKKWYCTTTKGNCLTSKKSIKAMCEDIVADVNKWIDMLSANIVEAPEPIEETTTDYIENDIEHTTEVVCEYNRRLDAMTNPNWHHVNLNDLSTTDSYTMDEKRRTYLELKQLATQTVSALYKCRCKDSGSRLEIAFIRVVQHLRDTG